MMGLPTSMMGMPPAGQTGQKVETYTIPGPLTFPIKQIIAPYMIVSMVVTNSSAQTLYLDHMDIETFSSAKIPIPPYQIYHVHGWFDNSIFINASANLTATEFITIQACDHMTTLPSSPLYQPSITPSDTMPTTPAIPSISEQMVYNPANNVWERQRAASSDGLSGIGIAASGTMVYDQVGAAWTRARSPSSDGLGYQGLLANVPIVYNPNTSQLNRVREAYNDEISSTGIQSAGGYLYNESSGLWDRARNNRSAFIVLPNAARTSQIITGAFNNYNHRGVNFYLTIFGKTAATTITITLQGADQTGNFGTVASSSSLAAVVGGIYAYVVYPGAAVANTAPSSASPSPCPALWRIIVSPSDANSVTYAISAELIL